MIEFKIEVEVDGQTVEVRMVEDDDLNTTLDPAPLAEVLTTADAARVGWAIMANQMAGAGLSDFGMVPWQIVSVELVSPEVVEVMPMMEEAARD
jgi:hypothetical protein